jgi:hypothetical protein
VHRVLLPLDSDFEANMLVREIPVMEWLKLYAGSYARTISSSSCTL